MSGPRVGNVIVPVADPARMAAHYESLLGEPKFRDGDRFIAFDGGGVTLGLARADEAPAAVAPGALVSLEVDDIYQWAREAEARGLPVGIIWTQAHELVTTIEDPEGNRLVVYSKRS